MALQSVKADLPRRYLTVDEAAFYLTLSTSVLNRLRMSGLGPRYLKISTRVAYAIEDLDDWATEHRRLSTSGGGGGQ